MKLLFVLLLLVPILLELTAAAPTTTIDQYGRVYRNSRMSKGQYQDLDDEDEQDDEEDADDEDADDDADDDNSGIYPPDFAKLFPNPDGRPVGPNSYDAYQKHHPANQQPNKPSHGPAAAVGPAASRGPVPQRGPPRNQASGNHGGYARPQYDSPRPQYGSPRPQYDAPPSQYDGPPPQYDSPPPQYERPGRRPSYNQGPPAGPPPQTGPGGPQYRTDLNLLDDVEPTGRQLYYVAGSRQVGPVYPKRNMNMYWNTYTRRNYQTYTPVQRYTTRQTYPVVPMRRNYNVPTRMWTPTMVRVPTQYVKTRQTYGRDLPRYNPFSRYSINSDYNPEYIVNPTEMLSRRKFRYHASQRMPAQRIPLYPGYWENPWVGHHWQRW